MSEEAKPARVLIVDNDRAIRLVMSQVAKKMGYEVMEVERATRAIPILEEGGVDAMLLDMHMPGPHGHHLLSYLKNNHIPVPPTIVVSGFLERELIEKLIQMGVSGIIAKPFQVRRLMDELRRLVEGRQEGRPAFCAECGAPASAEDRFCRHCGGSLERENICPECRQPCTPGDRFCGSCGASLGQEDAEKRS